MIKSKIHFFTVALLLSLFAIGCSKDDETTNNGEFVVAFEKQSIGLSADENSREIQIVFSSSAPQNGSFQVVFQPNNLLYGTDFTTVPPAENGIIELSVEAGTTHNSFIFNKLTPNPAEGEPEKSVEFSFGEIQMPNGISNGNTSLLVTYSESASLGGNFAPNVGGPNEPNQVYIDLSAQTEISIPRDSWDLGFFSGDAFRVKLNSSLFMMAAELQTTDLDAISEADVENMQTQMAFLTPGSNEFVDGPSGNIDETAISEISLTADENKVYLLKMGNEIGTETPETGDIAVAGAERGWMKIRILRSGDSYLLQYADLDSGTHQEIAISKEPGFNFTFFSLKNENIVGVEPIKNNWDLCFTTHTEVLELPSGGLTGYGFSDYVKTNVLADTKAYEVPTSDFPYENFGASDVDPSKLETDQRTIGANWRDVFEHTVLNDRFYVLEDADGNFYKIRFTSLIDQNGVRGYPEFQYELLN